MRLTTKTGRRTVLAAAVASAAILLPAVALASSAGPSAPAAAAVSRCLRGQLTPWMGIPGGATAGSTYYELEISNISNRTCTQYGFPGVSALGAGGRELGSYAHRLLGYTVLTVTLAPEQTEHVILRITDVGVYSPAACGPTTAYALRIYAPGDYTSMRLPFTFQACAVPGKYFLTESPVLAGAGIPGYSH